MFQDRRSRERARPCHRKYLAYWARRLMPLAAPAIWGCTHFLHLTPADLPHRARRGDPVTLYPHGAEPIAGTFVAVTGDSITLRRETGVIDTMRVPRHRIEQMVQLWWRFKVREVEADHVRAGTKVQMESRDGSQLRGVVARVTLDDVFLIHEHNETAFALAALDSARITRIDMTNALGITAATAITALWVRAARAEKPPFWVDR